MSQETIYKEQPIGIGQLQSAIEGDQNGSYTLLFPLQAWACLAFILADIIGNLAGLYGPTGWLVRLFPDQQGITLWLGPLLQLVVLFRFVIPNLKKSRWQFSVVPTKRLVEGTQGQMPALLAAGGTLIGITVFAFVAYFAAEKGIFQRNIWEKGTIASSNLSVYRMGELALLLTGLGIIAFMPLLFNPACYFVKGDGNQSAALLELNYKNKPIRAVLLSLDQATLGTFIVFQKSHSTGEYGVFDFSDRRLNLNIGNYLLFFPQMLQNSFGTSVTEIKSKGEFFTCRTRYILDPSTRLGLVGTSFSAETIEILRVKLFQNRNLKSIFDNMVQRALDNYVDFGSEGISEGEINQMTATAITFKEIFQRLEGDARLEKAKAINTALPKDLMDLDGSSLALAKANLEKSVEKLEILRDKLSEKAKLWHPYRLRQRDARDNLASQFSARLLRDLMENCSAHVDKQEKELTRLLQFIGLKLETLALDFSTGHAAECEQIVLKIEGVIIEELRQAQEQVETRLQSLLTEEKNRQNEFRIRILDLMKEFGPKYSNQIIEELLRLDDRSRIKAAEFLESNPSRQEKEAYLDDIAPRNPSPSTSAAPTNAVDMVSIADEV